MSDAFDRTMAAWAKERREALDPRVRFLIRAANWDLYFGPWHDDDPDLDAAFDREHEIKRHKWPGFTTATREIRDALDDVRELYVNDDFGGWQEAEPDAEEIDLWWLVGRSELLRALVGKELVEYVR